MLRGIIKINYEDYNHQYKEARVRDKNEISHKSSRKRGSNYGMYKRGSNFLMNKPIERGAKQQQQLKNN